MVYIPPEKHPPYSGNILGGQSNQYSCPVSCWSSQHACTLCLHNAYCDGWVMSVVWSIGRFPKDIIYGELALGRRTTGHPYLRYKYVCVRDMKAVDIDTMSWEGLATDRTKGKSVLKQHLKTREDKLMAAAADKRARRKEGTSSTRPETTHRHTTTMKAAIPILVFLAIIVVATTQLEINKIK